MSSARPSPGLAASGAEGLAGGGCYGFLRPPNPRPPTSRHNLKPQDVRVQVGQLKLYDGDQLTKVKQIIRHPKYLGFAKGGADIALLQLEAPLTLSARVNVVGTPSATLKVPKGKRCSVTGWGNIKHNCRCLGLGWGGVFPESGSPMDPLAPGGMCCPGSGRRLLRQASGPGLQPWAGAQPRLQPPWALTPTAGAHRMRGGVQGH